MRLLYKMNFPCSLTAIVTLKLFLVFYPNTVEGQILQKSGIIIT